jgi:hypothetical protein
VRPRRGRRTVCGFAVIARAAWPAGAPPAPAHRSPAHAGPVSGPTVDSLVGPQRAATLDDPGSAGRENAGSDFRLTDNGTIGRAHATVTGDNVLALHLCPAN